MNSLSYAGTHQGETMHWFAHAGHIFYFRSERRSQSAALERVNVCDSVERRWDSSTPECELPARVREELRRDNLEYRREASTITEAMV